MPEQVDDRGEDVMSDITPERFKPHPELGHLFAAREWHNDDNAVACTYYTLAGVTPMTDKIEVCHKDYTGSIFGIGIRVFAGAYRGARTETLAEAMEIMVQLYIERQMS